MDYTITRTVRTTYMDENGLAVDGYRVFFTMTGGQTDYVEIPKAQYNKANVEARIEACIAIHTEVGS